jgi:hypothetical protein
VVKHFLITAYGFAKKKVEVLIHTRLQPGDLEFRKRKPFKRFPNLGLAQFTWLKPGVNET